MPTQNVARLAFNRGQVSPLALARTDIDRIELSAEEQTNFVPRVLGSMMLRPGLKYLDTTLSNNYAQHIPFVFATDDKAVIEMTNNSMRVRVEDEIITRPAVSTTVRGGDFAADITNFSKLTDPSSLPASTGNGIDFSPDGQYMAHASSGGPEITIYHINNTTFTSIQTLNPAGIGLCCTFSPDSELLAIGYDTASPFMNIYYRTGTGASTTWTVLSNPGDLPPGQVNGISFSADQSFMAVAHATTPFVTVYQISGTGSGTTFAKVTTGDSSQFADAASLPASNSSEAAFSYDGRYLAVAHNTTPFVSVYTVNGTNFDKITGGDSSQFVDAAGLPTGNGTGVQFSRDGLHMAVSHTTTPFVSIYTPGTNEFTKLSNPATLPDGNGTAVSFSSDNQFLAVSHATTAFLTIYRYVSGVWTKQTDPSTLPDGNANHIAFSKNNRFLGVAHATSEFITVYEAYQWLDMDESGASSTYSSPTWSTASTWTLNGDTGGASFSGATVRQYISSDHLTREGTGLRLTFTGRAADTFEIDKCYVQYGAVAGDAYDFFSAPHQVTFNDGQPGFTLSGATSITSDALAGFQTILPNSGIVVSFHIVGANDGMATMSNGGAASNVPYYKLSVDQASTVNVSSYTNYGATRDVLGLASYEVLEDDGSNVQGLSLVGTGYNEAKRVQAISLLNADVDVEHALNITVSQGEVKLRVGTAYGEEDLISETTLGTGTHSLAFTPTTNLFFIQFSSNTLYSSILSSCQIAGAGDMTLATPYETIDLNQITFTQSADVIYLACMGTKQMKIERRGDRSWSIVDYLPKDGPFRALNTNSTTITPSALNGDITLTASRDIFRETHIGALFKVKSAGQNTSDSFTGANQFSAVEVRVTGSGTQRALSITRSGTWSATITLQRSLAAPGNWIDVATFTTNGTSTYTDELDNQIAYYRIGIKTGNYTSGTAVVAMGYASGGIDGIARVTAYNSRSSVDAIVLAPFGSTSSGSENWQEGTWSDFRGWPSAVVLYEGRLVWAGKDRVVLSKSDDYENFDESTEGDSAPMNRTIGLGPVDKINWAVYSKTLVLGGQDAEFSIGTTSFDEVLTPTNYHCDPVTNVGSSTSFCVKLDKAVIFAARTGTKLYQLDYNSDIYDYQVKDLSQLVPDICDAGILKMVYQRYPDTRVHCILNDGTVAMMIYEPTEQVNCWIIIETDGEIEDVVVLPGDVGEQEDHVYYTVKRTINGEEVRYYERWAFEEDCQGGTLNKQADAFLEYSGVPTSTITGLDHLEGEEVVAWGDGLDLGTYTVSGGSITLSQAVSGAIVGLPYTARYKSTKLAYAARQGTALTFKKALHQTGIILYNTHRFGIRIGDSFDYLDDLPSENAEGAFRGDDDIIASEDLDLFSINRDWSQDSRLCLEAAAPLPATILCVVMNIQTNG
jgi:6-phosphogluconolactonase (cycloisomerase 2 family)